MSTFCAHCRSPSPSHLETCFVKTKMCAFWKRSNCQFTRADNTNICLFAHGVKELRKLKSDNSNESNQVDAPLKLTFWPADAQDIDDEEYEIVLAEPLTL